jgi:hypothetical protein
VSSHVASSLLLLFVGGVFAWGFFAGGESVTIVGLMNCVFKYKVKLLLNYSDCWLRLSTPSSCLLRSQYDRCLVTVLLTFNGDPIIFLGFIKIASSRDLTLKIIHTRAHISLSYALVSISKGP